MVPCYEIDDQKHKKPPSANSSFQPKKIGLRFDSNYKDFKSENKNAWPSYCVVNCTNKHTKNSKLPFQRIPSNKTPTGARRRREWLKAINRRDWDTWTPERISKERVCGSHFLLGG